MLLVDTGALLARQPAKNIPVVNITQTPCVDVQMSTVLPGVFSLELSDVSVDSRASDLNFFSGTCSVVW